MVSHFFFSQQTLHLFKSWTRKIFNLLNDEWGIIDYSWRFLKGVYKAYCWV